MSTEIVELVEQATPYVSAALTAYGAAALTWAVGGQHIGIAASGDNVTIHPPQQ